jgi:hypothetical protein
LQKFLKKCLFGALHAGDGGENIAIRKKEMDRKVIGSAFELHAEKSYHEINLS